MEETAMDYSQMIDKRPDVERTSSVKVGSKNNS